ncbi:hypothetical protein MTR_2g435470 [Medicago truncatula]|uniref:Uncharacterized protein n=1 Tax=Medicago truncatula TaxID=3880 RepID=A0A072V5R6_MEDTR|nr:hypothetical protein MTR_2g435470 [Medicago truncatula]
MFESETPNSSNNLTLVLILVQQKWISHYTSQCFFIGFKVFFGVLKRASLDVSRAESGEKPRLLMRYDSVKEHFEEEVFVVTLFE